MCFGRELWREALPSPSPRRGFPRWTRRGAFEGDARPIYRHPVSKSPAFISARQPNTSKHPTHTCVPHLSAQHIVQAVFMANAAREPQAEPMYAQLGRIAEDFCERIAIV